MNRDEVMEKLQPISGYRIRQVDQAERSRVRVTPGMVCIRPGTGGALVPLNENGVKSGQGLCTVAVTLYVVVLSRWLQLKITPKG